MTISPLTAARIQLAAFGVSIFALAFIWAWLTFGPLWDMLGPQ